MTKADKIYDIAEKILHETTGEGILHENVIRLVSELRIQQSALEIQNKELRKTQVSLDKSRKKYLELYNLSSVGFFTLNKELIVKNVNLEGIRLVGRNKSDIINAPFVLFLTDDSQIIFSRCMKKTLETWDTQECEVEFIRKDKSHFNANIKSRIILDEMENFRGFQIAVKDISANKMVEELKKSQKRLNEVITELEQSNSELQSFNFITSHDLQEPLRTMGSYAGLLKRRYKGKIDEDADDFIEYIISGASRMQRMIIGLQEYSHLGRKNSNLEHFNAEEVLNVALFNLQYVIKECHGEVTHDTLPVIYGNKEEITKVFQNLIDNALKFRKKVFPPRIHVSAKKENNEYVFSVSDNGIGMEEQYTDRIFEVFKRLHPIGEYPGVGMGLAVVKRIINLNGGYVLVESKLGIGSTFYFTIYNK